MGEIFRRETAARPEPFTGERLTAAIGGQVQIEHYHRYLYARAFVAGLDVLDVASGEGYGSALLAQVARSVIGVEWSGATVVAAAANFPRHNLAFVQGDARALPLADRSVDVVVSFETIEHFDGQDAFVHEVRRVLRPDGVFIVSTPERDVYSPPGSGANPFHVHELSGAEFVTLLRTCFRHVQIMSQRPLIGSALLADAGSSAAPLVFERRGETHFEACIGLARAMRVAALARQLQERQAELAALQATLGASRAALDQARADLACAQAQARAQQQALAQASAEATRRIASDATTARVAMEAERQALMRERDAAELRYQHLQGSLHSFMRLYLPRLRRHLLRQRP
jgi:SAM-dependent methyltransferase